MLSKPPDIVEESNAQTKVGDPTEDFKKA